MCRQTDRQAYTVQTDRQTNRQAYTAQTDRHSVMKRKTDRQTVRHEQTDRQTCIYRQTGKYCTDRQTVRLVHTGKNIGILYTGRQTKIDGRIEKKTIDKQMHRQKIGIKKSDRKETERQADTQIGRQTNLG